MILDILDTNFAKNTRKNGYLVTVGSDQVHLCPEYLKNFSKEVTRWRLFGRTSNSPRVSLDCCTLMTA